MTYETVIDYMTKSSEYENNFNKLKYGFEDKDRNLSNFKNKIKSNKIYKTGKIPNFLKVDIKPLIKTSIPNSFGIEVKIKLTSPYYSSDDDDFYIVQNPCLKESVFKVPMVRGSGWKGALLDSAREIIKEQSNSKKVEYLKSYFRIFGVGDDIFRKVVEKIDDNSLKLFFMLSGLAINVNSDIKKIFEQYKERKAQKGRAIFYPTYFEKLSLELINPHNRKTKAGTNPIHYEVVPKESRAELKIVYIPFDGINQKNDDIKKEAKQDLEFLAKCIKKVSQNGIGAKTKLGWGRFEMDGEIDSFWSER